MFPSGGGRLVGKLVTAFCVEITHNAERCIWVTLDMADHFIQLSENCSGGEEGTMADDNVHFRATCEVDVFDCRKRAIRHSKERAPSAFGKKHALIFTLSWMHLITFWRILPKNFLCAFSISGVPVKTCTWPYKNMYFQEHLAEYRYAPRPLGKQLTTLQVDNSRDFLPLFLSPNSSLTSSLSTQRQSPGSLPFQKDLPITSA